MWVPLLLTKFWRWAPLFFFFPFFLFLLLLPVADLTPILISLCPHYSLYASCYSLPPNLSLRAMTLPLTLVLPLRLNTGDVWIEEDGPFCLPSQCRRPGSKWWVVSNNVRNYLWVNDAVPVVWNFVTGTVYTRINMQFYTDFDANFRHRPLPSQN